VVSVATLVKDGSKNGLIGWSIVVALAHPVVYFSCSTVMPIACHRLGERIPIFQHVQVCARRVASMLGQDARAARAGEAYSLGSVFAMKEFETWLLAGIESLRGVPLRRARERS
jgi:hypothetical protein